MFTIFHRRRFSYLDARLALICNQASLGSQRPTFYFFMMHRMQILRFIWVIKTDNTGPRLLKSLNIQWIAKRKTDP